LMEDPGYPGALAAFRAAGAVVAPMAVDAEGIVPPDRIPAGAVLYTTPSRQFPTGAVLTVPRRLALLHAAQRAKALILEDDYDSEFRYARAPMPSLHSLDTAGCVIYIGSMSKALLPTLRIGYAVLPSALVAPFASMRSIVDDHGPLIDQATLAEFISTGGLYSHIRRCRKEYRSRLEAFLSAAHTLRLPLTFPHTDGGMNLCGSFLSSRHKPDAEISREALAKGVEVPPISSYALQAPAQGLLFGFTAFDPSATKQALKRLAPILANSQA
jgi:GntR family transcriptional regulator / MocR family aminotransferase